MGLRQSGVVPAASAPWQIAQLVLNTTLPLSTWAWLYQRSAAFRLNDRHRAKSITSFRITTVFHIINCIVVPLFEIFKIGFSIWSSSDAGL
jgi:hypothetical protein